MMDSRMTSPKHSENSNDSSSSSHQQKTVIHEFVLVRRKARHCHRDEEDDNDDDNEDRYELEQGENWLKFLPKPGRSVLDDTQDLGMTQKQYPSILSLASVGSFEDDLPSKDCYLCIDMDGDVIAIKDMRLPDANLHTNNDSDGEGGGEEDIISSLEQQHHDELGISRKDVWEPLPRRQMRLLSLGDKLCTALGHMADGTSFPGGFIFQYRSMERGVNIQANSSNKSSSLFIKAIVKPEPTTPGGMTSILTQPQEDDKEELETETQTEPTPVKSRKDDDMDVAKDNDNDDEVSETTLEFQVPQPLDPCEVVLATQPNADDSDDETSLGDGERHSGNSHRVDTIPSQVILTSNSEDEDDDDDEVEVKRKAVLVKEQEPEDSQATVSDSQHTGTLGQETQDMTQATLRNSQLTAALHGDTQDATQATATQLTMTLQGETQDDTQATVRNSQLALDLFGETQDATQNTQLTVELCGETQDATQGAADESLTNTGLVQIQETDENVKEIEEASESSDDKSETLLGETGPDRSPTESFPDPIIQNISKDDDTVPSTSVEAGRVALSQESNLQDKKPTLEEDAIPLNTALSSEPVTGADVKEKENSALDDKMEGYHPDMSENEADALAIKENGSPTNPKNEKKKNRSQNDAATLTTPIESERAADADVLVESALDENEKTPPPTRNDNMDDIAEPNPQDMTAEDVDSVADQEGETDAREKQNESTIKNATSNARDQTIQDDNDIPQADDDDDDETQVPGKPFSRDDKKSPLQLQTFKQEKITQQGTPQVVSSPGHSNLDHSPPAKGKEDSHASHTPHEDGRESELKQEKATQQGTPQAVSSPGHSNLDHSPPAKGEEDSHASHTPHEDGRESEVKQEKITQQGTPQAVSSPGHSKLDYRPPAEGEEDSHASYTPHEDGRESEVKEEIDKSNPESNGDDDEPMKSEPVKKETTFPAESKSQSCEPDEKITLEQAEPATADTEEDNKDDVKPSTPAPRSSRRSRKTPASSNTMPDTQPASKRQRIEDMEASRSVPRSTRKRKTASTVAPASSRKKKQSSPTGRPGREESSAGIRVLTTGISLTDPQKHMITRIGGILLERIEDAASATHIIAGDDKISLRRTPKLMVALCKTSNIVGLQWLLKSAKAKRALPSKAYLLLDDAEAEKQYRFSMRETLIQADGMRANGKALLTGYSVHVCSGVAGKDTKNNKTPRLGEFKLIVEAAGASWMSSLPEPSKTGVDCSKIILISSKIAKEAKTQLSKNGAPDAIKHGATTISTEELFHRLMTQSLDV